MHQEIHYQLLTVLGRRPDCSQRQLAGQLGISLGKVNYCLKALVESGMIRPENPAGGQPRGPLRYRVTRSGRKLRIEAAAACLRLKTNQLKVLTREIELLRQDVERKTTRPEQGSVDVRG